MEMEPGVMATISVSTRRSSSVARDRVDFAVRMSDTVEGTALRTSRVWCAATVEDGITLPRMWAWVRIPLLTPS